MSDKAYEKEKDVLQHEVELNKDYLSVCDFNGGWNRFIKINHLKGDERKELIKHYIDIGEFAGLVRFINQQPQLSDDVETEIKWVETTMLQTILSKVNVTKRWQEKELETMRNSLTKIKHHIQAQASEIEELKKGVEICNNQAKVQHEQDMREIKEGKKHALDWALKNGKNVKKLNAIREVYNKLLEVVPRGTDEMLDPFYQAMDKQILKEEK